MPRNANTFRKTRRVCNRKLGCVTTRKYKQQKHKQIKQKQKQQKKQRKTQRIRQRGGKLGLADFLPTTTWSADSPAGGWATPAQATQFSAYKSAPPPLANGGMFTGPQSTGPWASTPFPPTQWAHSLEAATGSAGAKVFEHQKPNDNFGASFSPAFTTNYVGRK